MNFHFELIFVLSIILIISYPNRLDIVRDESLSDETVAKKSGWLCLEQTLLEVRDELALQRFVSKERIWESLEDPGPWHRISK